MSNFVSATARMPDMFNLIKIHKEIISLEEDILAARYLGEREITVNDTAFTDTTINPYVEFDNTVIGTADFATNTESVVTPGFTLSYNTTNVTFAIIVDGSTLYPNTDTTFAVPTAGGTLNYGSGSSATLTNTMTLDDVVQEINLDTATTGITASAENNGSNQYFLRLTKDNTTDGSTLIIGSASTASVLSDLGLTADDSGYVIDIVDVATQIGEDGAVDGSGPYNVAIMDSSGVYVLGGTALSPLGLTKSIDLATDQILITAHGFTTGDQVSLTSPATLPVPFNAFPDSFYYVIVVDANTIQLATTNNNALLGTNIDITVDGTDYFKLKKTTDAEIYYQVARGYSENTVYRQRYDEVLTYFRDKGYTMYDQTNPNTSTTFQWVIKW